MNTQKQGRIYHTCPKCGQGLRSAERVKNHQERCLATGRWKEVTRARS